MDRAERDSWTPGAFDILRSTFLEALGRGDAHGAAEVYSEDARVLLPDARPMEGRPAIEAFWRTGIDSGMSRLELIPTLVDAERGFACEVGRYVLSSDPGNEARAIDEGRYLIVHRRQPDGAWRRALEIFEPAEPIRAG
jgi:ketosteroid isomerase-like protein